MKNILKYSVIICLLACMHAACERQDALMYENDARIAFKRGERGYGQQDSVIHSFFLVKKDKERDTVWIEMSASGFPDQTQDRPLKLVQTNAGAAGAAVAGKHYVAFDDPAIAGMMVLPQAQVEVKVPVILIRDASLDQEKVRIEMTVGENEYFKPGIDLNRNFMVQTTAMPEMPSNWQYWSYYFGKWGVVKMDFIVNTLGFNTFDELPDTGYRDYLKLKAREELTKYNTTHEEPLCENKEKKHAPGEVCVDCLVFP